MRNLNLTTEQIETINHDHIHSIDKLYRMHAGISSQLISVKNGIAQIEVEINSSWPKSNEVTAKQFIESWSNHNPDLKEVDGWEVRIFTSEKIAGFTISPIEIGSPELQKKIDQMNAKVERSLNYTYKVYKDAIKHPIFTIRDSNDRFYLEFSTQLEVIRCGFFDIKSPQNYLIYNSNLSGNLFVVPHIEDDYLLISKSEYEYKLEFKYFKSSAKPVTYNIHSKLLYLINLQKEGLADQIWQGYPGLIRKIEINIGTKNC